MVLAAPATYGRYRPKPKVATTNLVYKPRRKAKYKKKAHVAKSYLIAYNKLAPSKEKRFDFSDLAMVTNATLVHRS